MEKPRKMICVQSKSCSYIARRNCYHWTEHEEIKKCSHVTSASDYYHGRICPGCVYVERSPNDRIEPTLESDEE